MEINGKKVVDAKKRLEIHVNAEDCKKGKTKDPGACAAARAIIRENAEVLGARVHRGITYLEYPDRWVRYLTPTSLATELTVFDRGANFEPSVHSLNVPKSQSLASLAKRSPNRNKTGASRNTGRITSKRHHIPNIRPRGANR